MKQFKHIAKIIFLFLGCACFGQVPGHSCGSPEEQNPKFSEEEGGLNCISRSQMATDNDLFIPYPGSNIPDKQLKVRLIFIHHSSSDPRNFDANNNVHQAYMDDIFLRINQHYINFEDPNSCGDFLSDSKIQFVIKERLNIVNSDYWNNCTWGNGGCSSASGGLFPLYDWLPSQGIDRDMINMVFTESEGWYNEVINGAAPYPTCGAGGCSASSPFPTPDLSRGNVCHMLNKFTHWTALTTDYLCPVYPDCCPSSCPESWLWTAVRNYSHELGHSVIGRHLTDGCENLMNSSSATVYVSTDQLGKLHRGLSIHNTRRFVDGCPTSPLPIEITEDETWDMDFRSYNDIIVKTGSMLTLTCILNMPTDKKIIVERGATLIVDGATITSSCDEYWEGIEVWGNANENQPLLSQVLNGNYPANDWDQGVVIIKNNATIENANNAIVTSKRNCGQSCHDLNFTGGIVYVQNSTFLNNWRTAEFMKYETDVSISQFISSSHLINDDYFHPSTPNSHISNWDVKNIKVVNCLFKDDRTNTADHPDGLKSIDGSYYVSINSFDNVDTAICVYEEDNIAASIQILDNTCTNSNAFAYVEGANVLNIWDNTINLGVGGKLGIGVKDCASSFTTRNSIIGTASSINAIVYQSNGPLSHIAQKNVISDVACAVKAIGDNSGLKILCNQFYTNDFDIRIENSDNESGEIFANQGQLTDPAGNLFGGICKFNPGAHIYMTAGAIPFTYYHHNPKAYKPLCTVGPVTIVNTGITFDPQVHCTVADDNPNQEESGRLAQGEHQDQFKIYPNPIGINSSVFIEYIFESEASQFAVSLYDALGNQVLQDDISTSEENLDISSLSPGVYLLVISDKEKILHQEKLIVL